MRTVAPISLSLLALALAACGGRVLEDPPSGNASGVPASLDRDAGSSEGGSDTRADGGKGVPCFPSTDGVCPVDGALHAFTSTSDVLARLQGEWLTCTGAIWQPGDAVGISFSGSEARFLVKDASGAVVPGSGFDYERAVTVIDTVAMNGDGPGRFQVDLTRDDGSFNTYVVDAYDGPAKLRLNEGTSGNSAQYAPSGAAMCGSSVDAGPSCGGSNDAGPATGDGGACSLAGTWDVASNTPYGTNASFQFESDGTFVGGDAGASLPSQATRSGHWSVDTSGELVISATTGFLCNAYQTNLSLSFSDDCRKASLSVQTDGCTGGRQYLDDDTVLTRR